ncbi:MAG: hypothetical protein ACK559_18140, partial [bacterium]
GAQGQGLLGGGGLGGGRRGGVGAAGHEGEEGQRAQDLGGAGHRSSGRARPIPGPTSGRGRATRRTPRGRP